MIETHIHIRPAYREDRLVGSRIRAVSNHQRPALTKIRRFGDYGIALVVLQPGSVERPAINGIHHDLRIKLATAWRRDLARRLPRTSIVVAHYQNQGGQRTTSASRHRPILWIENIHMTVAVGSDCGFPLVTGLKAFSGLKSETRA